MENGSLSRYPVPAASRQNPHCSQLVVRRSRFLASSCRAGTREEAREFIELTRALYPDATHNCWAFAAGPPGDTALVGSSDDGEPRGTAGRPMLNALLHCGTGQICVVVSRWFGGIKLGTGGLARAYQDAVLENVRDLPLASAVPFGRWRLTADYASLAALRRLLPGFEARIEAEEYGVCPQLVISAPLDQRQLLEAAVADASRGSATFAVENGP